MKHSWEPRIKNGVSGVLLSPRRSELHVKAIRPTRSFHTVAISLRRSVPAQDVKLAYTHRDLAQKCIGQGMLEAAQMCLLRIKPANWEVAGDATARELMRAVARSGDKTTAMQ